MKIGIVCYDAGGGEILSSYVKLNNGNYFYSIMGPSIDIFKRKLKVFKNNTLKQIIPKVDLLICGTSAKSNHELDALKMAKGIKTICFLDHWTNYSERFLRADVYTFPDDFWVSDKYAFDLFKKTFPKKTVSNFQRIIPKFIQFTMNNSQIPSNSNGSANVIVAFRYLVQELEFDALKDGRRKEGKKGKDEGRMERREEEWMIARSLCLNTVVPSITHLSAGPLEDREGQAERRSTS